MSTANATLPNSSLDHCSMMMMMMTITEAAAGLCSLHALEIKDHKKLPNKHPFLLFAGKPAAQKTKLLSREKIALHTNRESISASMRHICIDFH